MKRKVLLILKYLYSLISLFFLSFYLKKKKKVLFISHDMSISGAPLVLKKVIDKVKYEYDFFPVVLTLVPGEMCFTYIKEGIFPISCQFFNAYIKNRIINSEFEKIFVNTIICIDWIDIFENNKISYIWWIHEGHDYIDKFKEKLPKNVKYGKVLFVSAYSKEIMMDLGFSSQSDILPYFISEDTHLYNKEKKNLNHTNESKKIIIIGSICPRKNQLEVVEAFKHIQMYQKKDVELLIVGKPIDDAYYDKLLKCIDPIPNIKLVDYVPNNQMWRIYKAAEVLVCCSTDDPLPVTVTEAFLYGCKAIVSSNCGQYHLISNKKKWT